MCRRCRDSECQRERPSSEYAAVSLSASSGGASLPESILLGFQRCLFLLGTTVILRSAVVLQMGGNNEDKAVVMQMLMVLAGINTLLKSFFCYLIACGDWCLYTFVLPTISIILLGPYTDEPHIIC